MSTLKILHAADLHLDSAFEALPAGKAQLRRTEQRELLARLATLAREEQAQLILLAGDLLDSDTSYYETGEELCRCLAGMNAPVFISPGNHDYYSPRSPWARIKLPGNVHLFTENAIRGLQFSTLGIRVYGAAFTEKRSGPLLQGFTAERKPGMKNILILHGEVGAPADSPYDPITEAELAASGMDYVALGHIHRASGLRRAGDTWFSWPGCPEGRGFDEPGRKGVIAGTVDRGACALRFVPLQGARYESLEVDVTGGDPMARALAAIGQPEAQAHYRLTLVGETSHAPDPAVLEAALKDRCAQITVTDNTRVVADLWAGAGEDSLRGEFLARMERRCEQADPEQAERIRLAARLALGAMDGYDFPEMELP